MSATRYSSCSDHPSFLSLAAALPPSASLFLFRPHCARPRHCVWLIFQRSSAVRPFSRQQRRRRLQAHFPAAALDTPSFSADFSLLCFACALLSSPPPLPVAGPAEPPLHTHPAMDAGSAVLSPSLYAVRSSKVRRKGGQATRPTFSLFFLFFFASALPLLAATPERIAPCGCLCPLSLAAASAALGGTGPDQRRRARHAIAQFAKDMPPLSLSPSLCRRLLDTVTATATLLLASAARRDAPALGPQLTPGRPFHPALVAQPMGPRGRARRCGARRARAPPGHLHPARGPRRYAGARPSGRPLERGRKKAAARETRTETLPALLRPPLRLPRALYLAATHTHAHTRTHARPGAPPHTTAGERGEREAASGAADRVCVCVCAALFVLFFKSANVGLLHRLLQRRRGLRPALPLRPPSSRARLRPPLLLRAVPFRSARDGRTRRNTDRRLAFVLALARVA